MSSYPLFGKGKDIPMQIDAAYEIPENKTHRVHQKTPAKNETPLTKKDKLRHSLKATVNDSKIPPGIVSTNQLNSDEQQVHSDSEETVCSDHSETSNSNRNTETFPRSHRSVWSHELEVAFEEALSIIPKFGRNKLKTAGKLCGRNELIAEYIYAKTGIFRSVKQVSSHMQVVKNLRLKSKRHIIRLINRGPHFKNQQEFSENIRRFKKVFAKFNISNWFGLVECDKEQLMGTELGGSSRPFSPQKASSCNHEKVPKSIVTIKDINFTISGESENELPIILTMQKGTQREYVDIELSKVIMSRFPGVDVFQNIPILHNHVKIFNPLKLERTRLLGQNLNTNFIIEMTDCIENMAVFSTVYSFGGEILRTNEMLKANSDQPFLIDFWKCLFLQFIQYPISLDAVFKELTVKQIVYDNTDNIISVIPRNKIVAVILWEFSEVEEIDEAISSSSRLLLPASSGYASIFSDNHDYYTLAQQNTLFQTPTSLDGLHHQVGHLSASNSNIPCPNHTSQVKDEPYHSVDHLVSPFRPISFPQAQPAFPIKYHGIPPQTPNEAFYSPYPTPTDAPGGPSLFVPSSMTPEAYPL